MSLTITCNRCGKELDEPGALVFAPPNKKGGTRKFHICERCWHGLMTWLLNDSNFFMELKEEEDIRVGDLVVASECLVFKKDDKIEWGPLEQWRYMRQIA